MFIRKRKRADKIVLNDNSKILFIRLNRIGDALVSTSLLYNIKSKTNYKIFVVASKYNHFIFNSEELCDEVIVYDKNEINFLKLIKIINSIKPDAIIDLHNDVSTTGSFILAFSKAKFKIGFNKWNNKLYDYVIEQQSKTHIVDRLMSFSQILNVPYNKDEINIHYKVSENALSNICNYINNNKLNNVFKIGINISAGNDSRFWSIENYKRLLKDLSIYKNAGLIVLCSPNDVTKAKEIADDKYPIFYNNSFEIFTALISKLNLLITPDTSVVHVASAYKVPVFGLYVKYKTSEMIWYPYKSKFECVITEEPTLHNIKYESVINKLKPFIEELLWKN
ncbi:glycosyltransferase family 9 protein [Rosettibacter firmus]|uniref:glycosyltransferase family 9 protein n=1 Tax=Rosettibacter firmus TaxID=3111522 RepID=UPI00336BCE83